jgi:hypothetical protein
MRPIDPLIAILGCYAILQLRERAAEHRVSVEIPAIAEALAEPAEPVIAIRAL